MIVTALSDNPLIGHAGFHGHCIMPGAWIQFAGEIPRIMAYCDLSMPPGAGNGRWLV
jgi:hypothetical protein